MVSELFGLVRDEFARKGLLRRAMRITAHDTVYSVRCDEDCFTVYRINKNPHLPPGLPGWVVCRISNDDCFCLNEVEELGVSSSGGLGADEQVGTARAWTDLVLASLDECQDF